MRKTEAVVIGVDGVARLQELDLPEVTGTRVRVKTVVSGVSCGTEGDCASGRAAYIKRPHISGYQAVGRVEEVGGKVTDINVGDLVVTSGGGLWGMTSLGGGSHARESVAEQASLVKLEADKPSLDSAAYAVLAAVAYEALWRMKIGKGGILGVYGLGMLGQMAGRLGQIEGLKVIGINRSAAKREVARKFGFDGVAAPDAGEIIAAAEHLGGQGVNFAFDTTGNQQIFDLALQTLASHGEISLNGYYPDPFVVSFDVCHKKNASIHNPVGHGQRLPEVVRLISSGALNVDLLISHRVKPAEIREFFADLVANHGAYLGAVIDWE